MSSSNYFCWWLFWLSHMDWCKKICSIRINILQRKFWIQAEKNCAISKEYFSELISHMSKKWEFPARPEYKSKNSSYRSIFVVPGSSNFYRTVHVRWLPDPNQIRILDTVFYMNTFFSRDEKELFIDGEPAENFLKNDFNEEYKIDLSAVKYVTEKGFFHIFG